MRFLLVFIFCSNLPASSPEGKVYYYLKDHLGSTRITIDGESGGVTEATDYYPFGKILQQEISGSKEVKEKYTGKEFDEDGCQFPFYPGVSSQFKSV